MYILANTIYIIYFKNNYIVNNCKRNLHKPQQLSIYYRAILPCTLVSGEVQNSLSFLLIQKIAISNATVEFIKY